MEKKIKKKAWTGLFAILISIIGIYVTWAIACKSPNIQGTWRYISPDGYEEHIIITQECRDIHAFILPDGIYHEIIGEFKGGKFVIQLDRGGTNAEGNPINYIYMGSIEKLPNNRIIRKMNLQNSQLYTNPPVVNNAIKYSFFHKSTSVEEMRDLIKK